MLITVAGHKGGIGKTTTAIHLAAYFEVLAPTLLIDGDAIRAATRWGQRGSGFRFKVVDESAGPRWAREYTSGHIIIDTEANPSKVDFEQIADGCDLLVIPAVPEATATDGLAYTLGKLNGLSAERYRVLLTKVPPRPRSDGDELRSELEKNGIPIFKAEIPQLVCFDKASAQGVVVSAVNDKRAERAWKCYQQVGREIYGNWKRQVRSNHIERKR